METISNHPKLARAKIIYLIDVVLATVQTIGIVIIVIALSLAFPEFKKKLNEKHATSLDDGALIGTLLLMIGINFAELALVFILRLGIAQKSAKKLRIWLICQAVLLAFHLIDAIIDLAEKKYIGSGGFFTVLFLSVYRTVAVKIVYDAVKELTRFPVTVPFVPMRNGGGGGDVA